MSADKDGDVAVVEFFDYNCGYCKRAVVDMMALIPMMLKEFPVLGPSCVEAAQVAVAMRMQVRRNYLNFSRSC